MESENYQKYRKYKKKYKALKKQKKQHVCKNHISFDDYMTININKPEYRNLLEKITKQIKPVYVTLNDIEYKLKYISNFIIYKTNLHYGQRKLFLNELQFLTNIMEQNDEEVYVIYAGAAPNNHIYYLHELFPNVKFILVDPRPFSIHIMNPKITHLNTSNESVVYLKTTESFNQNEKINMYDPDKDKIIHQFVEIKSLPDQILKFIEETDYRIFIIQDLYTDELSKFFSKLNGITYFWSDIRTGGRDKNPDDMDIIWNLAQQLNWVRILKPDQYMLKFRCPFFVDFKDSTETELWEYTDKNFDSSIRTAKDNGIDFIKNYVDRKLIYLDGLILIQPWGPINTTETRLVGSQWDKFRSYECINAEEKFFYYNNFDRPFVRHVNMHIDKNIGFDYCNDCSLEANIWENYKQKYDDKKSVIERVKELSNVLGKNLKKDGHGELFEPFSEKWYKELYYKYCY